MTLVLGEMDVVRVNLYQSDQGTPSAHGLVRAPTASGGHPIPGADTRLSLVRWTTSTMPGLPRAFVDRGWRLERTKRGISEVRGLESFSSISYSVF